MPGFQPLWRVDDLDDDQPITQWMERRNALAAARTAAEAAGRQAWQDATYSGADLSAVQPSDVVALGAGALTSGAANDDETGAAEEPVSSDDGSSIERAQRFQPDGPLVSGPQVGFATARPGDSISTLIGTSDPAAIGRFLRLNGIHPRRSTIYAGQSYAVPTSFDDATDDEMAAGAQTLRNDNARLADLRAQQAAAQAARAVWQQRFNSGLNVRTGERHGSPAIVASTLPAAPASPQPDSLQARRSAARQGYVDGLLPGMLRGGVHAVEGLGQTAGLAARLGNPAFDHLLGLFGHSAEDDLRPVSEALGGALDHPAATWRRVQSFPGHVVEELDPWAMPLPTTVSDAHQQGKHYGANHGEFLFNAATIPIGGEVAEGAETMALARNAVDAAGYRAAGMPPEIADYFAKPYSQRNMGSHWFSRDARFPSWLGGGPLPASFLESRYNVWKPRGATNGQIFETHVRNDLRYGGGPLPDRRGPGTGWSGAKIGWTKNPPVERFINRMPAVTKGSLGGAALAGFDAAGDAFNQDQLQ